MLADELLREALRSLQDYRNMAAWDEVRARRHKIVNKIEEYLREFTDEVVEPPLEAHSDNEKINTLCEMIRRSRIERDHSMDRFGLWNLTPDDFPWIVPAVIRFYAMHPELLPTDHGTQGISATDEDLANVVRLSGMMPPDYFQDRSWSDKFNNLMRTYWPRNWVRKLSTVVYPEFITYRKERQYR